MINQAQGIIIDQKWTYMWLCIKSVKAKLHIVAIIWNPSCHCPSAHACSLLLLLLSFCTLDSRVWSVPLLSGWLITRGMTMVVITSWMGVDKCHPDQVRNSGFGSNYPSSLSDPSITSITPLLISFPPLLLSCWSKKMKMLAFLHQN